MIATTLRAIVIATSSAITIATAVGDSSPSVAASATRDLLAPAPAATRSRWTLIIGAPLTRALHDPVLARRAIPAVRLRAGRPKNLHTGPSDSHGDAIAPELSDKGAT